MTGYTASVSQPFLFFKKLFAERKAARGTPVPYEKYIGNPNIP